MGDAVDSGVELASIPVLAKEEFGVFWLQVLGIALLSIAILIVPLMT